MFWLLRWLVFILTYMCKRNSEAYLFRFIAQRQILHLTVAVGEYPHDGRAFKKPYPHDRSILIYTTVVFSTCLFLLVELSKWTAVLYQYHSVSALLVCLDWNIQMFLLLLLLLLLPPFFFFCIWCNFIICIFPHLPSFVLQVQILQCGAHTHCF